MDVNVLTSFFLYSVNVFSMFLARISIRPDFLNGCFRKCGLRESLAKNMEKHLLNKERSYNLILPLVATGS